MSPVTELITAKRWLAGPENHACGPLRVGRADRTALTSNPLLRRSLCIRSALLSSAACLLASFAAAPLLAQESENPLLAIAREQRQRDEIWAQVESARLSLVKQALEQIQDDKLRARTERQQVQLKINHIRQNRSAREWALQYLKLQEKRARDNRQLLSRTMERWARAREVARQKYVQFPERSVGEVRSGRALNFFLDLCGSTALNLGMYFDDVDEQIQLLNLDVDSALTEIKNDPRVPTHLSNRLPASHPPQSLLAELCRNPELPADFQTRLVELDAQWQLVDQKQKTLNTVGGHVPITAAHLNHLKFSRGQLGPKLTLRLAEEPMPLDWPYLLEADPKYQPYLQTIEAQREEALRDLRSGKRVAAATADLLSQAVDGLYRAFQEDRLALYHLGRGPDFNHTIWRTTSYLKTLRGNAAYLISADDIGDVTLTKSAAVNNAGTLLAYMMEHGLRFAPAEKTDEDAYHYVYRLLVDFYVSLDSLSAAIEREPKQVQADLKRLEAREQELLEIEFQDTMDAFTKALQAIGQEALPDKLSKESQQAEDALAILNSALSQATAAPGPATAEHEASRE